MISTKRIRNIVEHISGSADLKRIPRPLTVEVSADNLVIANVPSRIPLVVKCWPRNRLKRQVRNIVLADDNGTSVPAIRDLLPCRKRRCEHLFEASFRCPLNVIWKKQGSAVSSSASAAGAGKCARVHSFAQDVYVEPKLNEAKSLDTKPR